MAGGRRPTSKCQLLLAGAGWRWLAAGTGLVGHKDPPDGVVKVGGGASGKIQQRRCSHTPPTAAGLARHRTPEKDLGPKVHISGAILKKVLAL